MKMMVATKDTETMQMFHNSLSRFGYLDKTVNGMDAVTLLENSLFIGNHYEVVFVDISLADIDATEAVRIMRRLEYRYRVSVADEVKIIMIVNKVHSCQDVEAYISGIADNYLEKPLSPRILINEMEKIQNFGRI